MPVHVHAPTRQPLTKHHRQTPPTATGTYVGDVLELQAIGEVLGRARRPGQEPLRIASVKSNIGHAEVSAGMFSLAKVGNLLLYVCR